MIASAEISMIASDARRDCAASADEYGRGARTALSFCSITLRI
jgi:hypothetical protein